MGEPKFNDEKDMLNSFKNNIIPSFNNINPETGGLTTDYLKSENQYVNNKETYDKLTEIYNIRKRMLEVNLDRNDVKNKIIYSLFALIMIIIIISISVHTNFKK